MIELKERVANIRKEFYKCVDKNKLFEFMRFNDIDCLYLNFDVKFCTEDDGFTNICHIKEKFERS